MRVLLAVVLLVSPCGACGPKTDGATDTGAATDPGESSGSTSMIGAECTPGDTKAAEDGCMLCECDASGTWQCPGYRCNPTSGVATTGEPGTGTTADTSSTTAASTTAAGTDTGTETGDATTGGAMLPPCGPVEQSDEFSIGNAALVGDSLVVDLAYAGGCETHDFSLCFAGFIIEEGWRLVRLEHDAHGDGCKVGIQEQRSFDLTPLQEEQSPLEFVLDGWGDVFVYEY